MRKIFYVAFFGVLSALALFSCGMHDLFDGNENRMVEALQEALVLGSRTAASNLGDTTCTAGLRNAGECAKGYLGNKLVEIAVPDTVKNVLDKINSFTTAYNALPVSAKGILETALGAGISHLGKYGDSIKVALNRGAEQAAPASIEVFKNAIFGMSIIDAKGMLLGDSIAATTYLHTTTYDGLQSSFALIIERPLDLLEPNKFWEPIASSYNSFARPYSSIKDDIGSNSPLSIALSMALGNSALPALPYSSLPEDDISGYLANYATGKALDGLFLMVGKQESQLREDPWGTVKALGGFISDPVGDLLGDVFGKAKDGLL